MSTITRKTRKIYKNPISKSVQSNCISAKERGPTVTAKDALYLLAHGTTFHLKQCSVNTLGYIYKSLKQPIDPEIRSIMQVYLKINQHLMHFITKGQLKLAFPENNPIIYKERIVWNSMTNVVRIPLCHACPIRSYTGEMQQSCASPMVRAI